LVVGRVAGDEICGGGVRELIAQGVRGHGKKRAWAHSAPGSTRSTRPCSGERGSGHGHGGEALGGDACGLELRDCYGLPGARKGSGEGRWLTVRSGKTRDSFVAAVKAAGVEEERRRSEVEDDARAGEADLPGSSQ
jgi:hypothetical protein